MVRKGDKAIYRRRTGKRITGRVLKVSHGTAYLARRDGTVVAAPVDRVRVIFRFSRSA